MTGNYIGTKQIKALPMTLGDYNTYRGWELSELENGRDRGYLVEYTDGGTPNHTQHEGYISWSPEEVFENSYVGDDEGMSFGHAIVYVRQGKKVARQGWNGKGMFVYLVPANKYPAQTEMIKGVFKDDMVPYREYLALKTAQDDVAMWSPSGSDALATDWVVVE